jgi:cytochrome c oxidase subunit 2
MEVIGEAPPKQPLTLAAVGERVGAQQGCLRCHTVDGTPHIGPTWAGLYGATVPLDDGAEVVADEAYLTSSMMDPAAQLHRGYLAVMPSYQGLLTAAQVGALVEYIRSLRDVPRYGGEQPLPLPVPQAVPLVNPLEPKEAP